MMRYSMMGMRPLVLAMAVGFCCAASGSAWAENDIQNGGMETFSSGVATGWTTYTNGDAPIWGPASGSNAHNGLSQQIQRDSAHNPANCGLSQLIDANVGDALTFEVWGKVESYSNIKLSIHVNWDGAPTLPTSGDGQAVTSWTKLAKVSGNATSENDGVRVFLHSNRSSGTSTRSCWFDDAASYHAYVPPAPTIVSSTLDSIDVDVERGGNYGNNSAQYAITIGGGSFALGTNWVQANGTIGTSADWRTDSEWGVRSIANLATGTTYSFRVKARYSSTYTQETSLGPIVTTAIVNGSFSSSFIGWSTIGFVSTPQASSTGNYYALLEEPATGKPGGGSISQIRQDFYMPTNPAPQQVHFRYQFIHSTSPGPSAAPPDSFQAFLVNADTGVRLVPDAGDPPNLAGLAGILGSFASEPLFYQDTNGLNLYKASKVAVKSPPDPDGLTTVSIDVSTVPSNQHASLIFSLASTENESTSAVLLDDVGAACPPYWCCDATTGQMARIDDGNPCTLDLCIDGQVSNISYECCGECADIDRTPVDIVVMLDGSYSTSIADFETAKTATENLIRYFKPFSPRPRIAVGVFSGEDTAAGASIKLSLTNDYDYLLSNMGLVERGGASTPLRMAIRTAREHLTDPLLINSNSRKFILLVTDGWTTRPNHAEGDTTDCCPGKSDNGVACCDNDPNTDCKKDAQDVTHECRECICSCSYARQAAEVEVAGYCQSDLPERPKIEIIAAHYIGQSENTCDMTPSSAHVTGAKQWLREKIATKPNYFLENPASNNAGPLICQFIQAAELINCDDNVATTKDSCLMGVCVHETIAP